MKIQYIGFVVVLGIFLYQLWRAIHTKNYGEFNKTSMIVWGSIVVLVIAVVAVLSAASHV